ncbi:type II secretion system protein [Campylobacter sp. faydin G-140]|uniref:pilus assembly FimT family protein n=1 Tax=Campylobacter anatolicus TaxID=2829105 RepID=UPI001B9BEB77|nr:type II secretion system protein [Campylobacter anatolicus]MBR8465778.1 type II secretion system protein [Campylobacter anatolicus]
MRRAFTFIEIVFVLVIISILSAIFAPKMKSNSLKLATEQIVSHIRYTQHLAVSDDKFSLSEDEWYKGYWRIYFYSENSGAVWRYAVFFDERRRSTFSGNPNSLDKVANDPSNAQKKLISGFQKQNYDDKKLNKKLNLTKTYGINSVKLTNCGQRSTSIAFDNLGRPHSAMQNALRATDKMLSKDCVITLFDKNGNQAKITILKETGFVKYQIL